MAASFDVIVIGAGPAGEVAAGRIAQRSDLSVALVEMELVGGECSFYACMPSKALLRPQELLREIERVPGVGGSASGGEGAAGQSPTRGAAVRASGGAGAAGSAVGEVGIDVQSVLNRRDEVIHRLSDESQLPWLEQRGVTLLRGEARLHGERRVTVDGEPHEARRAVIVATGSSAALPPIPGLAEARPWTNREASTAKRPPRSLIVLGGGPVGVEMAQAWRSLGSEVTLVEAQQRLLPSEEPFAGEELRQALQDDCIDVRLGAKASAVRRDRDGEEVKVTLDSGAELVAEELLVAIGRTPRTDGLGLESVGLTPGEPIEVEDTLRVPQRPWLYAIGDVNGRVLLTHMGKYQARIAADNILAEDSGVAEGEAPGGGSRVATGEAPGGGSRIAADKVPGGGSGIAAGNAPGGDLRIEVDGRRSPRVTFTDPEVAAVGHTLASAKESGIEAQAVDMKTSGTAGASFHGREAPGSTRFVVDMERRLLVGATFVGPQTAELLHAASIAIVAKVPLATLSHAIPAFPTRSELWLQLSEACED